MKVDNLLAQYLYKYKTLSLPRIGVFTLDDSATFPDENSKTKAPLEGISFVFTTTSKMDDSLVEFVKTETGKMKALAQADLDSYTALAHQFLNIGKPFYFEGIGTLQKNKDGSFSFSAGTAIAQRSEEAHDRHGDVHKKTTFIDEQDASSSNIFRKVILALGIIGSLVVVGWGGYYLYNKNANARSVTDENNLRVVADSQTVSNILPDTSTNRMKADTNSRILPASNAAVAKTVTAATPFGSYKFVFEVTDNKARALKRYNYLKPFSKIQLATPDSVHYKLFVNLARPAGDTTKLKDSLNSWYWGTKNVKVKIEH